MKITVLTLFPEMFSALDASILGRAKSKGLLELEFINIREFAANKHKKTDDYPFGGGAGMVMSCQPIYDAVLACDPEHSCRRVYLSPKGRLLCQPLVQEYAKGQDLLLLCGHYEGVDQRVLDLLFDEELSIGDYVLTGGELPAMVLIDCVARYLPEVLHSAQSVEEESFSSGLLEYPQYTRPEEFLGVRVSEVLLSGNHAKIAEWRREQSLKVTAERRPELLDGRKRD